jgi:hypothetical protein
MSRAASPKAAAAQAQEPGPFAGAGRSISHLIRRISMRKCNLLGYTSKNFGGGSGWGRCLGMRQITLFAKRFLTHVKCNSPAARPSSAVAVRE